MQEKTKKSEGKSCVRYIYSHMVVVDCAGVEGGHEYIACYFKYGVDIFFLFHFPNFYLYSTTEGGYIWFQFKNVLQNVHYFPYNIGESFVSFLYNCE